jgi:membrane-associated phospholipid phosphatase
MHLAGRERSRNACQSVSTGFAAYPSSGAWAAVAALGVLGAALLIPLGVTVHSTDAALLLGVLVLLLGLGWFYATHRPAPPIAAACQGLAFIIAVSSVLTVLSYLVARAPVPLLDGLYARWDAAIGFDWLAHRRWVASWPALETALKLAYFSFQLQLFVIIVALAALNRPALREFLLAFLITACVTIAFSLFFPAMGAFHFHKPELFGLAGDDPLQGRWHYAHLEALRAGALDVIPLRNAEGLIQFPSFHAVMAALFARALWQAPYLGPPAVALNGLVVLSTLSIGGHYLVDVIAGGFLAAAVLVGLRLRQSRELRARAPDAAFAGP